MSAAGIGLGRLFDVSMGINVVDLATGANTGNRVSLKNADAITVLFVKETSTDTEPAVLTFEQYAASSGGSPLAYAKVDTIYKKTEATLDGDEVWTKVSQSAGATFTESASDDTLQGIYAITVRADQLADGYSYLAVNIADTGTTGTLGTVLYILHDLAVKRAPENLVAPLS